MSPTPFELRTDLRLALKTLIRVPSRDRESRTVPLDPLPAQDEFLELYNNIRSLNIAEQLQPGTVIFDDPDNYGLPKLPTDLGQRFELIKSLGPDLVLETLEFEWNQRHGGDGFETPEPMPVIDGPVRIDVLKCRRGGISSLIQAIFTLRTQFRSTRAITVAQKGQNSELVHGLLASYYRAWSEEFIDLRQDASSLGIVSKWANGSTARCFTAGGKDSGRSDQGDLEHFSEAAFFPIWDEVKSTLAAAPAHAHIFIESTANGENGGFYHHYQETLTFGQVLAAKCRQSPEDAALLSQWNGFYRFFFSWLKEPAYKTTLYKFERNHLLETLDDVEKRLVAVYGTTPEQLQWRRKKIKESGDKGDIAKTGLSPVQWFQQEFPADENEAFQSTGRKVFGANGLSRCEAEALKRIVTYLQLLPAQPIVRTRKEIANLHVVSKPRPGHLYSMGVDLSKGLSTGDWSVFSILDRLDGSRCEEAATWRARHAPEELADVIATLGEWYNGALVVPELEGPAISVISRLVKDLEYDNIYIRNSLTTLKDTSTAKTTWQFGWFPTPQAKWSAIYDLSYALESGEISIFNPIVLGELRAYENIDRKLGAPSGKFDDGVTAVSLAYHGTKCEQALPIDPAEVLAADRAAEAPEGVILRPDSELWDYLRKLDARTTKDLESDPFFRKYGFLPD